MKTPPTPLALLLASLILTGASDALALDVAPSDTNIQYEGRWDHTNPAQPTTSWGHGFRLWFTGTSISVKMSNAADMYYEYSVDGAPFQTVSSAAPMTYSVASGLGAGSHSLVFRRRLEGSYGLCTFQGIVIDDGAMLEAPHAPPSLRLEFIGDSITAGFGSEGQQTITTNNINVTWAARVTEKLGAQRNTVARSGIAVSGMIGAELQMRDRYVDTHFSWNGANPTWDFSSYIPDAVFILLGTNDYIYLTPVDGAKFKAAYSALINTVRGNYANAEIFAVNVVQGRTTPEQKWRDASSNIEAVVTELNAAGDMNVHFVDPGEGLTGGDFSDTTHPLPPGHEKMAENMLALVQPIIGSGSGTGIVPGTDGPDGGEPTGSAGGMGVLEEGEATGGETVSEEGSELGTEVLGEPTMGADGGGEDSSGCNWSTPERRRSHGLLAFLLIFGLALVRRAQRTL